MTLKSLDDVIGISPASKLCFPLCGFIRNLALPTWWQV